MTKKYSHILIFTVAILLFVMGSCHPIRTNNSGNLPATLVFGQGGGITGKYIEYSLLVNGELWRHDVEDQSKLFLKKIKKNECRNIFSSAERLRLLRMDYNHPYNMNYYIVFKKGVDENKVNWGDSNLPPPEGIKELFETLWQLTR